MWMGHGRTFKESVEGFARYLEGFVRHFKGDWVFVVEGFGRHLKGNWAFVVEGFEQYFKGNWAFVVEGFERYFKGNWAFVVEGFERHFKGKRLLHDVLISDFVIFLRRLHFRLSCGGSAGISPNAFTAAAESFCANAGEFSFQ